MNKVKPESIAGLIPHGEPFIQPPSQPQHLLATQACLRMPCPLRKAYGCDMEDIRYVECWDMPESESQEPHLTQCCMGGRWRHM